MTNPLVSILIANYNNGKYFQECWNSLLKQSYTNWEVILVDDFSTDNSMEQIIGIVNNDNRFKYLINSSNKGCGFSKRVAAENAKGEYAIYLDPDDYLHVDALGKLVQMLDENQDAVLVYANLERFDDQKTVFPSRTVTQIENGLSDFINLEGKVSAPAMFKMKTYQKTMGIDPFLQRAVDQDLYLKLYEVGDFVCLDEVLYFYRIHSGGISTGDNAMKADYWQWMVVLNAAKRRNLNLESVFENRYVYRKTFDQLSSKHQLMLKSKSYKLGSNLTKIVKTLTFRK